MEVEEALADDGAGLDSPPYEVYYRMSDLFGHLIACVSTHWQRIWVNPRSVSQGVVKLL